LPAASRRALVRGQSANGPQELQLTVANPGPNNYVITSEIEGRARAGGSGERVIKAAYGGNPLLSKYPNPSAPSAASRVGYGLTRAATPQGIRAPRAGALGRSRSPLGSDRLVGRRPSDVMTAISAAAPHCVQRRRDGEDSARADGDLDGQHQSHARTQDNSVLDKPLTRVARDPDTSAPSAPTTGVRSGARGAALALSGSTTSRGVGAHSPRKWPRFVDPGSRCSGESASD
jgi:hypothetical protein